VERAKIPSSSLRCNRKESTNNEGTQRFGVNKRIKQINRMAIHFHSNLSDKGDRPINRDGDG